MRETPELRPALGRFLARLGLAYVALTVALSLSEGTLYAVLLPVLKVGIEKTHPEFLVTSLSVEAHTLRLQMKMGIAAPGRMRLQQRPVMVDLPALQLLECPILALAVLLAWPHRSLRTALLSLALALPLIALAELLDVPYAFAAAVSEKLSPAGSANFGALWWFFLDNGGRQLLALAVAPLAVWGSHVVVSRLRPAGRRRPVEPSAWFRFSS